MDYETTVTEIEAAIAQIETGELPLEDVFERFEGAIAQLKDCEEFLQRGKDRMALAVETLSEETANDG